MWEDLSLEKYVMGEEKFNEKGTGRRTNLVTLEKKRQIQSLIYNAGCLEPLYYGV